MLRADAQLKTIIVQAACGEELFDQLLSAVVDTQQLSIARHDVADSLLALLAFVTAVVEVENDEKVIYQPICRRIPP